MFDFRTVCHNHISGVLVQEFLSIVAEGCDEGSEPCIEICNIPLFELLEFELLDFLPHILHLLPDCLASGLVLDYFEEDGAITLDLVLILPFNHMGLQIAFNTVQQNPVQHAGLKVLMLCRVNFSLGDFIQTFCWVSCLGSSDNDEVAVAWRFEHWLRR